MDASKLFKGQKVTVECPGCDRAFKIDASLVFKTGSRVTCPHCDSEIDLETSAAKKEAEKMVKELKKMFK
jgi:uncharacterized Zn-finger protein